MPQKKKLQVFVSSTYADLKEERQAAVEAILTAGHIPAGMELFAAGDESQMNAIRRWIDESDVFLLILGGRYGSIDPKSQKSYIQLEYEYAIEKSKPLFAVVIDDNYLKEKVKKDGIEIYETENPQKLKDFRSLVLSKLVRFWSEPRDIKLAILETMSEFTRRDDLVGWIPGNEGVKAITLTEEIARLAKENTGLREQLAKLPATSASETYNGLTFEEVYNQLIKKPADLVKLSAEKANPIREIARADGPKEPNLLHFIMASRNDLVVGTYGIPPSIITELELLGLVKREFDRNGVVKTMLTEMGKHFLLRLTVKHDISE